MGLTKDVAAFANTVGGYLIFGVRDSDKEVVGLSDAVATVLADVNNLQQKINRHLEPALGTLRAKAFDTKQGRVVAVYVPRSAARTHLIRKDGEFEFPSGKKSVLVRQGTIYVRRTGGNHLADSRDLDQIIDRRLEHYRETLLSRIAKIVEAPVDSQVFLLKHDVNDPNAKRYVIHDAPDAIPIKGLSFTVAPEGAEEQIAAWVVLSQGSSSVVPPLKQMWEWYVERENLQLADEHRLALAQFSLWRETPTFFWLTGLRTQDIQRMVLHCAQHPLPGMMLTPLFQVAGFLGRSFFNRLVRSVGDQITKLAKNMRSYPTDIRTQICGELVPRGGTPDAELEISLKAELNEIANAGARIETGQLATSQRSRAIKLDCYLYAQNDRYA